MKIEPGTVFKVELPFHKVEEEESEHFWWDFGPGKKTALGYMVLTVVDIHKPGKFHTRVFYTKTWVNPDGEEFGSPTLRMISVPGFKNLLKGYRYPKEPLQRNNILDRAKSFAECLNINVDEIINSMGIKKDCI